MSTISSIANNTYTMYKMAEKSASSTEDTKSSSSSSSTSSSSTTSSKKAMTAEESKAAVDAAAQKRNAAIASAQSKVSSLSNLVSSFGSAYGLKSATNSSSNVFSNLWSSYSSAAQGLSSIRSVTSGAASLVSSYNDAQKTFSAQFTSSMTDLQDAAKAVKKLDFSSLSSADITTDATTGKKTYSDNLKSAIASVKDLVSSYNDALSVTSDYKSVSNRMTSLNTSFSDTTYRTDSYKQYGISVDSKTGKLSVDEDKLATALANNSSGAEAALGKNGLAGKAEGHATFALSQKGSVFPSMQSMLGDQLTKASAYTNPTVLSASMNASMLGNLIDSMF